MLQETLLLKQSTSVQNTITCAQGAKCSCQFESSMLLACCYFNACAAICHCLWFRAILLSNSILFGNFASKHSRESISAFLQQWPHLLQTCSIKFLADVSRQFSYNRMRLAKNVTKRARRSKFANYFHFSFSL